VTVIGRRTAEHDRQPVNLQRAILVSSDLTFADLGGARLFGADLTGANLFCTNRPAGIVHSMAWLLSSVASAKYSARSPAFPAEATSETGLPSHRDRRPSVCCPGPTAVQPSGRVIIGSSPS
jgi:hypothetical protein